MRGTIDAASLPITDSRWLLQALQLYLLDDERFKIMHRFNHQPSEFELRHRGLLYNVGRNVNSFVQLTFFAPLLLTSFERDVMRDARLLTLQPLGESESSK